MWPLNGDSTILKVQSSAKMDFKPQVQEDLNKKGLVKEE